MKSRMLALSIALNVIIIPTGLFLAFKRLHFQQENKRQQAARSYLDNPQYIEQMSIQGVYDRPAKIVLLGNSHIFKAHWEELLNRDDIAVRGIGSDITVGYIARLDQVMKAHPSICFIEGGTNDLFYHIAIDTIIDNLKTLVDFLRAHRITPVLHQLPPWGRQEPNAGDYNRRLQELNGRIRDLAKETETACIDLHTLLEKDGYLEPAYCQADGIHLTGAAYRLWAQEINHTLEKLGIK